MVLLGPQITDMPSKVTLFYCPIIISFQNLAIHQVKKRLHHQMSNKEAQLCWPIYRNVFGSFSEIFGDIRKMVGNVCVIFGRYLDNFRKSKENLRIIAPNSQKSFI